MYDHVTHEWAVGETVSVVEHDDTTRQPRPDGRVLTAEVVDLVESYVTIRYTNARPADHLTYKRDQFWRSSGWRAWDGMFTWRLTPVECNHDLIDPHAKRCQDCGQTVSDELADAESERRAGCYRDR